ncbi:MAG: transcription termination/antitermination protein NusA [Paludibacteraceae bacterium]|jgi:N utilization substance protein A|nr:transcription termination/antitermination protein NusA [Paludibacteraceae bacterium]
MATANKQQESINLIDIFQEFNEFKRIDKQTFINVLKDSFTSVITKMYGNAANYDVIVNPDKGDLEIYRNRLVMEDDDVANPETQIALSDALKLDDEAEVGEEVTDKVEMQSFGRRMILNLRQTLASKILELQKESLYQKYKEMVGDIVTGELYQVWKKEMLLLDEDGNELYLPKQNQIPTDYYRKGEMVRAVVVQVDNNNQNPKIILSRTAPLFLQRLFEQEVPEVKEGLIAIKNIARIPGERAKVAVETFDERIDPVGACVGVKGARIHGIVRELRNENIDVISYTSNINLYIQRALAPAKISSMEIDEESKTAKVYLQPDEVSLAIGKGGYNIKLACMLTGYQIDVYREINEQDLDDIYLDEFNDEIDQWVLDAFKAIGLDTAKDVLGTSKEELLKKTDLEEETIDEVLRILAAEFEND